LAVIAVIGHVSRTSGVGESARRVGSALRDLGHEVRFFDAPLSRSQRESFNEGASKYNAANFDVTILVANPDLVPAAFLKFGLNWRRPEKLIGFWSWEFENAPKTWGRSGRLFDEVWTNSDFSRTAIATQTAPIPVFKLPMKPRILRPEKSAQKEDSFTFLTSFDFLSDVERKNPEATLAAFRLAFGANPTNVKLVVKSMNSNRYSSVYRAMKKDYASDSSIVFVDGHLSQAENIELLGLADCFVSLHRSEGFGLNIFDALAMGIKTISTKYSGNLEYAAISHSYLIDVELVPVRKQYSIYRVDSLWAEPSLLKAAEVMRFLAMDGRISRSEPVANQALMSAAYEDALRHFGLDFAKRIDFQNENLSPGGTRTSFSAKIRVAVDLLVLTCKFVTGALRYRVRLARDFLSCRFKKSFLK
jgi:glycosyltransferase involved in cell wall biosynthesis